MTVEQLIAKLNKIKNKRQRVLHVSGALFSDISIIHDVQLTTPRSGKKLLKQTVCIIQEKYRGPLK